MKTVCINSLPNGTLRLTRFCQFDNFSVAGYLYVIETEFLSVYIFFSVLYQHFGAVLFAYTMWLFSRMWAVRLTEINSSTCDLDFDLALYFSIYKEI